MKMYEIDVLLLNAKEGIRDVLNEKMENLKE